MRIKNFLHRYKGMRRLKNEPKHMTSLLFSVLNVIELSGGVVTHEVYKKVEDVFTSHQLKINNEEIQPMMKEILTEENIQLNVASNDWQEAIKNVAQPLLVKNIIEPRYVDAMIDSLNEFGPYIVIGQNLALAHARPEDGANELGISVMTLSEPVMFGNLENDPVKIIFCLAAIDSYSHLNIMKDLVELINDEDKIQQLVTIKEKVEFQKLLFSKKNSSE